MNNYTTKKVILGAPIVHVEFTPDEVLLHLADLPETVAVTREFCAINQPNKGDFYIIDGELTYTIENQKFMHGDYVYAGVA